MGTRLGSSIVKACKSVLGGDGRWGCCGGAFTIDSAGDGASFRFRQKPGVCVGPWLCPTFKRCEKPGAPSRRLAGVGLLCGD